MKRDEKVCPKCAEPIKKAALVCKHCGNEFSAEDIAAEKKRSAVYTGFGVVAVIAIVASAALNTTPRSPEQIAKETEEKAKEAAETAKQVAENRRNGFHCLSPWDGSHRALVEGLKSTLRDPRSFEHAATRITPRNQKGLHRLTMEYRAKNGFGGMNVGVLVASVKSSDCSVVAVISNEAD